MMLFNFLSIHSSPSSSLSYNLFIKGTRSLIFRAYQSGFCQLHSCSVYYTDHLSSAFPANCYCIQRLDQIQVLSVGKSVSKAVVCFSGESQCVIVFLLAVTHAQCHDPLSHQWFHHCDIPMLPSFLYFPPGYIYEFPIIYYMGFPSGTSGKEPACQCRRHKRYRFYPQIGKIP